MMKSIYTTYHVFAAMLALVNVIESKKDHKIWELNILPA